MADALRLALHREALDANGRPTKRLTLIADRLVQKAVDGDIAAIKDVFDRIDGRAIPRDQAEVGGQIVFQINTGIFRDGDGALPSAGADPLLIEGVTEVGELDAAAEPDDQDGSDARGQRSGAMKCGHGFGLR
jgi:hypothetical protein